MKRKIISLLLTVAMAASLAVGCGGNAGTKRKHLKVQQRREKVEEELLLFRLTQTV